MKIIHLITSLGLGGAERQLKALVSQSDTSFQHIVISLQDEGIIGEQLKKYPHVKLYCLNLQKSLWGLWHLYRILRREKPHVLQTWLYHADLAGLVIGKMAGVRRIVWNIRCSDMDLSRYTPRTANIVKILKVLSRFPTAIITNSHAGQKAHMRLGYKPRQWMNIANGIDTDLFYSNHKQGRKLRHALNIPDNAIVIGMLGRVDPMKDYATFLEATDYLARKYDHLYFLIAGKDTDKTAWPVIPLRFHCLGIWENAPEFLNALDIMVLSSAFGEGFPNVVGEAMACEKPVVVSDVGDAALIVQAREQVIPPQQADKLVLALERLLALSSSQRQGLGKRNRDRILNLYSLFTMRQRYALFYKELGK